MSEQMSKRKAFSRAWWLFLAVLFLMTGVILTVILAVQSSHNSSTNQTPPPPPSSQAPSCQTDASLSINQADPNHKLAGQKLASFTPKPKVDQLTCIDIKKGSGTAAQVSDTVTVHYTGALAKDGTIFQSSLDTGQPVTLSLLGVIQGWSNGVPGMQPGGIRRLYIPAGEGYGSAVQAGIPANSDLVFDIQLISIVH